MIAAEYELSPTQQRVFDEVLEWLPHSRIVYLDHYWGNGATAVITKLQQVLGGEIIGIDQLLQAFLGQNPLGVADQEFLTLRAATQRNAILFVDPDRMLVELGKLPQGIATEQSRNMRAWIKYLIEKTDTKLIMAGWDYWKSNSLSLYMKIIPFQDLAPADFRFFAEQWITIPGVAAVDFEKLVSQSKGVFAWKAMGLHEFKRFCAEINRTCNQVTTESFLRLLREAWVVKNDGRKLINDGGDHFSIDELIGVPEVTLSIEKRVVVPIEHEQLARSLQLQPARGILLYGPPGTGKTSVGRALADR